MRVVAVVAADPAFDDRMVRRLEQLRADLPVARDARFVIQVARSGLVGCYRGIGPVERYARTQACVPCSLWQLLHETSFFLCLPESQNARCRLLAWTAETDGCLLVGGDGLVVESQNSANPAAAALLGVLERPLSVARHTVGPALVARLAVLGRKIGFTHGAWQALYTASGATVRWAIATPVTPARPIHAQSFTGWRVVHELPRLPVSASSRFPLANCASGAMKTFPELIETSNSAQPH